jgi:hypothetical protein
MFSRPQKETPPVDSDATPKSSHSRTGWTPVVCKKGERFQIRIACQRSNGRKSLYSSSASASKIRPPWAPVSDCEYVCDKASKEGESKHFFGFVNCENEKKKFSAELLNPLIYSVNPFTQKCAKLVVENKLKLLAQYLSLTSKAEGFITHQDQFDKHGFALDESQGLKEKDIVDAGGSVEEVKVFQKLSEENAFIFGGNSEEGKDFRLSSLNKRKITDFFDKKLNPKKMTKTERTETNFKEEMENETGLEKSLVKSYVNFKYVNIDRLGVSPKLFLKLNDAKVRNLVESMETRFEPTQIVLTVCPEDIEKYENSDTTEGLNFLVIVGQHRLEALKALDKLGKLDELTGIRSRKVPCYICRADSAVGANYANIRSNDISSKFKSKVKLAHFNWPACC